MVENMAAFHQCPENVNETELKSYKLVLLGGENFKAAWYSGCSMFIAHCVCRGLKRELKVERYMMCAVCQGNESGHDWDLKLQNGCQQAAVGGKEIRVRNYVLLPWKVGRVS